jgi:hypothetical protein
MVMGRYFQIHFSSDNSTIYNPLVSDIFNGLEEFCIDFNEFFLTFFSYMKYLFAFILIMVGLLTLFRYRGIYLMDRIRSKTKLSQNESVKEKIKKIHVFLGMSYVFMGFGIIFNFLTYIALWILEPLPDGFLFQFLGIGNIIDPSSIYRISNYNAAVSPHERTIYFCFALVSFLALLQITLSIWFITNENKIVHGHYKTFLLLIAGLIEGMFVGFTTCLRFFL